MAAILSSFLALTFCAALPALAGSTVQLEYDWRPGISAQVQYRVHKTKSKGGAQEQDTRVSGEYTLSTREHPAGLRVDVSHSKVTLEQGGAAAADPRLQQFINRLAALTPSYVLSTDGELVDVIGLEAMRDALREELEKLLADVPAEFGSRLQGLIASVSARDALLARMRADWRRDVAQWAGAQLEQGYVYQTEFSSAISFLGNLQLPGKATFEYLGPVPCHEQAPPGSCVSLRSRSFFAPEDVGPVLRAFFQQMGKTPPQDMSFTMDTTVDLITEPDTLLPHRVESEKITRVSLAEGQPEQSQRESKTVIYRYGPSGRIHPTAHGLDRGDAFVRMNPHLRVSTPAWALPPARRVGSIRPYAGSITGTPSCG